MFYSEVFDSFNRNNVRYLVVGGVAMNLHGVPRMTYDLDVMIALDPDNSRNAWHALISLGFSPRVPVTLDEFADTNKRDELLLKKNMIVLSFFKGTKQFDVVDIFVKNPIDFEVCYRRKKIYHSKSINVTVVDKEDLIQLKSLTNRQQDAADIESLKKLSAG